MLYRNSFELLSAYYKNLMEADSFKKTINNTYLLCLFNGAA